MLQVHSQLLLCTQALMTAWTPCSRARKGCLCAASASAACSWSLWALNLHVMQQGQVAAVRDCSSAPPPQIYMPLCC